MSTIVIDGKVRSLGKRIIRDLAALAALVLVTLQASKARDGEAAPAKKAFSPEQVNFFETQVRPILKARCLKCHGDGPKIKGGLRLDSREAVLRGGDLGPAVSLDRAQGKPAAPGDPLRRDRDAAGRQAACRRDRRAHAAGSRRACPGARVADASRVAPASPAKAPAPRAIQTRCERLVVAARRAAAGSRRSRIATGAAIRSMRSSWPGSRPKACEPAPEADRVTLIRRLKYDLTGLPPTPEEVDAFVADRADDAYERLVDRLLESPHYGEKWGRHWLDLVRYAETNGYERDSAKPFAWRYRDYVIDAFNHDKPFDQFIREQLAGDEIDPTSAAPMIATGYYRLGIWDDEPADRPLARYDGLDGIISTTGQVFLGMTINCARCHDHKIDPIPQRDYYRLLAFFQDIVDPNGKNLKKVAGTERFADRGHVRRRARPARHARPVARQSEPAGRQGRARRSRGPGRSRAHVCERARQAPGAGRLAGRPAEPPDGPRAGQPDLAVSFRPRNRADTQRFRRPGRTGDASRAARLAGGRTHGRRLAAQANASADRALERLPDGVARVEGRAGRRPGQSLVLAVPDAPAHRRGGSRLDPGRQRHAQSQGRRTERLSADPARGHGRASRCRARAGQPRRRPRRPGAASTCTSSDRSWSRSWRRMTRPIPTSVARCAIPPPCPRRPSAS